MINLAYKLFASPAGYTVPPPSRGSADAAGLDLRACIDEPIVIEPGESAVFPLGVAVHIPRGHVGIMAGRSSLGVKHCISLCNSIGVIDADYRGELNAALINLGKQPYTITQGERIVQLVIVPFVAATPVVADELEETERGAGGFGSTGKF